MGKMGTGVGGQGRVGDRFEWMFDGFAAGRFCLWDVLDCGLLTKMNPGLIRFTM